MEPNVCTTKRRFEVLEILRDNGIPTVVWLSPLLPFINDTKENVEGILDYCIRARVYGIICFGMGMTLRQGNREYFYGVLDKHFPGLREQYHHRYGYAYEITSDNHRSLMKLFHAECKRFGIVSKVDKVFDYLHQFPENDREYEQLRLF